MVESWEDLVDKGPTIDELPELNRKYERALANRTEAECVQTAQTTFWLLMANKVLTPFMDPEYLAKYRTFQRLLDEIKKQEKIEQKQEARMIPLRQALQDEAIWYELYEYAQRFHVFDMETMRCGKSEFVKKELKKRRSIISSIVQCTGLTNEEIIELCVEAELPHFCLN